MARDVLTSQVLVAGRIRDRISGGQPRRRPRVSVLRDTDGRPLEDVAIRLLQDAHYAVHGDPARMLPPAAVTLRVEAEAEGYAGASFTLSFTAGELARVPRVLTVAGETDTVSVIDGLPRRHDIDLDPLPVTLAGRVSEAEDPEEAISGAAVRITAPAVVGPVTTDGDGFFTLGSAPVAETVTLEISVAGRDTLTTDIRLNFSAPVNRGSYALEPN